MAWKLTVDNVDRTASIHLTSGATIAYPVNDRASAHFTCLDGYVPARFAEVVIYDTDGTTPLFGGLVLQRRGAGALFGSTPTYTGIECGGFETYLDWCYLNLTYPAATTLGTVLTAIQAALPAGYGITLDAGMGALATAVSAFTWTNLRASDALRNLADAVGMTYYITPAKAVGLATLGSTAAPVSLTDATPNCREVEWTDSSAVPANTVILACGPTGTGIHTQVWTVVGAETAWVADLAAAGPGGYWVVTVDPPVGDPYYGTVGIGAMFTWDWSTKTLTSNIGALTAGTTLTFPYTAQYPFLVTVSAAGTPADTERYWPPRYFAGSYFPTGYFRPANVSATPEVQVLLASEETLTVASGQQLAAAYLAMRNQQAVEIVVQTLDRGAGRWQPGQALTVSLTARGLTGTYYVSHVEINLITDLRWVWTIQATSSPTYQGSYLDGWRALQSGSSSATPIVASLAPATAPAAVPPLTVPMGGSTSEYHIGTSGGTWFDIANPIRPFVVGEYYQTRAPQVRCRIWGNDATTLTVRVYNLTTAAVAGTGSNGSATPTEIEIPVTLANGRNEYIVQVQPGDGKSGWVASAIFETVG